MPSRRGLLRPVAGYRPSLITVTGCQYRYYLPTIVGSKTYQKRHRSAVSSDSLRHDAWQQQRNLGFCHTPGVLGAAVCCQDRQGCQDRAELKATHSVATELVCFFHQVELTLHGQGWPRAAKETPMLFPHQKWRWGAFASYTFVY